MSINLIMIKTNLTVEDGMKTMIMLDTRNKNINNITGKIALHLMSFSPGLIEKGTEGL